MTVVGVEGVVAEDFAVVGDDGGVVVVDESGELGAPVGVADAEMEHAVRVAERDLAGVVGGVVADAPEVGGGGSCSEMRSWANPGVLRPMPRCRPTWLQ